MGKTTNTIALPRFPTPGGGYDRENESQFRRELERAYQDIVSYVSQISLDPATLADHVLATEVGIGAQHSVTGLTNRHVLIASNATAVKFRALVEADISDLTHYTSSDFGTDFTAKDTGDLSEGANLYFTDARADARIAVASLADMATRSAAALSSGTLLSARLSGVYTGVTGLGVQVQALNMGTGNDILLGALGTFDSTSTPSTDFILRYNGSKWVSAFLQTQFGFGDGVSQVNGDGTTAAFVQSNPSLSGAPAPNPSVAPVVTPTHKAIKIDMSAYTLGANETFVLDYAIDAGGFTTDAIITTGPNVIHSTLSVGSTYKYKYKIRGASDTPYTPISSAINPLNDSSAQSFGIVLASEIVATNLAAIVADIGDISAGKLRNNGNTLGILLSGSLPGGWTSYINFTATGVQPILKFAKFELRADGDAIFKGQLDITDSQVGQTIQNFHMILRDPDVDHGMTDVVEEDVIGAIGSWAALLGGLAILGFSETSGPAVILWGLMGGGTLNGAVQFRGAKKNGEVQQDLSGTNVITAWFPGGSGATKVATLDASGAIQVGNGTASLPSLSFVSDPDTGFYRKGANQIGVVIGAEEIAFWFSGGIALTAGNNILTDFGAAGDPGYGFNTDSDTGMYRSAANELSFATAGAQRAKITVARFQIFNELLVTGKLGLYGTVPVAKGTVTGSRSANPALADLLTKLAAIGIVSDNTTA